MHRLEQVGVSGGKRLLHRDPSRQTEGELGAVDAMITAVDQCHRAIDDLEAKRSFDHRFDNAFLDSRDPLLGHRPAVDFLLKHEA